LVLVDLTVMVVPVELLQTVQALAFRLGSLLQWHQAGRDPVVELMLGVAGLETLAVEVPMVLAVVAVALLLLVPQVLVVLVVLVLFGFWNYRIGI
jgi:hypothetical protein